MAINPDRNHRMAVVEASRRRSVIRYEQVGSKIVMIRYSLVHGNNQKELMKACEKLAIIQQRVNESGRKPRLKVVR